MRNKRNKSFAVLLFGVLVAVLLCTVPALAQENLSGTSDPDDHAGLNGEYFDNQDLTNLKLTRTDPKVDFSWGSGSPDPSIAPHTFSVRWSGQVKADHTETYTFYASTNDGVRLRVNGQQIINRWSDGIATNTGTVSLQAGQWYSITMEYYEGINTASAKLEYSSPSTPRQVVPTDHLRPEAPPDTTAPTVSGVAPEGAGVAIGANAEATFSEAMDASTINDAEGDGSFTLTKQGATTPVAASVSYDGASKKTTLNPIADLEANTTYTATVKSGANGVKDLAGNPLAYDKSWSFTTTAGTATTGLKGEYFDNLDFTNLKLTRTDPTVNFDWDSGSPEPSIGPETFSVRWTGQVKANYSETYTFDATGDDYVRLYVNGQLVAEKWATSLGTATGTIALQAGQWYDIKMEYGASLDNAAAKLEYSSTSEPRKVIPQTQLRPPSLGEPPPPPDSAFKLEAETISRPAGASVVSQSDASGAQALRFTQAGNATASVTLDQAADRIVVVAKAPQGGSPDLELKVNGVDQLGNGVPVTSTAYADYPVNKALGAGTYNITIRTDAGISPSTPLDVDVSRFEGAGASPPPPPPSATTYLSDLSWTSANNDWGPVEKDTSNGETAAGDGRTIALNGTTHRKGLGVHAISDVRYNLSGLNASTFAANVGVDDEVGANGSVTFEVYTDGAKVYDSGVMTGSSASKDVSVNVSGKGELRLVVTTASDGNAYDHADWADAKLLASEPPPPPPSPAGELKKWHPLTISFTGPSSTETNSSPNPFLDYRLQVTFTSPSGKSFEVPGFYDGDGNGASSGSVWKVRFNPDESGTWGYKASFRQGTNVAIDTSATAGSPTSFDGASGTFDITARDSAAPGFLSQGLLEYANGHYLKFRDGSYYLKGGADSPENWLGYAGFDNTPTAKHSFSPHVQDWQTGDPTFNTSSADGGKGLIGALNYLSSQGINSIYFLPMNIGGDGRDSSPYVSVSNWGGSTANDNLHFDVSKLGQWEQAFAHAQRKGIHLHFVLNEAEGPNKQELDGGTLGNERKLFYREMVARFAHHNALQWNVSEEYDYLYNLGSENVKAFADYIQRVDPYDHPITVHNLANPDTVWAPFVGDSRFSLTSFQFYGSYAGYGAEVEKWRSKSASAGRPLPIGMDEVISATTTNAADMRRGVLWPTYLSGGNLEWYVGSEDQSLEDFRRYGQLWAYTRHARTFMEGNLPFWAMQPQDGLLLGESSDYGGGQVFAKASEVYAVYLPNASSTGTLDLSGASGSFQKRWYNPRSGAFEGSAQAVSGGAITSLGAPPSSASSDWVVLIEAIG